MIELRSVTAPVFNIQSYCIHDGPGIRSTVFVKGCPLRCLWCHNPESNRPQPELMEYGSKCTGCGQCAAVCPQRAISVDFSKSFGKMTARADRTRCDNCGRCVEACPHEAREISGRLRTAGEVFDEVAADKLFYDASGGGVTISGGEVLLAPAFASALFQLCHAEQIHTAIESCMFADRQRVAAVMEHADLALCDIKHMDCAAHRRLTGVGNEEILENIRFVKRTLGKPVIIRTPVVPSMNDSEENITATARFIADALGTDTPYQLLPYHNLGQSKLESLGRAAAPESHAPDAAQLEQLQALAGRYLQTVQIGGD